MRKPGLLRLQEITIPHFFLKSSGLLVGDDAYIVPAEQADFAEVYGKFATFSGPMWASAPTWSVHVSYCFAKTRLF